MEKTLTHQHLIICDNSVDNPPDLFSFPFRRAESSPEREKNANRRRRREGKQGNRISSTDTYRRSPHVFTVEIKLSQTPRESDDVQGLLKDAAA